MLAIGLRKSKNKVVYGTADDSVIQSLYIDRDALGDAPPNTIRVVISPCSAGNSPGRCARAVRLAAALVKPENENSPRGERTNANGEGRAGFSAAFLRPQARQRTVLSRRREISGPSEISQGSPTRPKR